MRPSESHFITGTDTDIGKTYVTADWIAAETAKGRRMAPMKPVSAGCRHSAEGLRNDDAEQLLEASGLDLPYARINRYAFEPAIAPHIAAIEAGVEVEMDPLVADFHWLSENADQVLVEGAGGWRVPLGPERTTADLVRALDIPVILVVGMRLGCLNHALLSEAAILADGCRLTGWVASFCEPQMARADDNLQSLRQRMQSPLLWICGYQDCAVLP